MSELPLFVSPTVVVGLDFGTTYSGFAFAHRSDPDNVQLFFDWPHQSRPYCKTQTSLFYVPSGKRGEFELEDWGYTALDKYTDALQRFRSVFGESILTGEDVLREVGVFATCFKLYLADPEHYGISSILPADLPPSLTPERMIVDYLRCISDFIVDHLKEKYGRTLTKRQVQWCLTVPAIWSERSKSKMEMYAEKAGLVHGRCCPSSEASVFPLKIILEPEAASFSCQKQLMNTCLWLSEGDKFIVADIGGGTIDIVVHEKAERKHSVHEVCPSYGELGGGTFVDRNFFQFLKETIGCFQDFKDEEPTIIHKILGWWLGPRGKYTFDGSGSKFMEVPRKLSKAWKQHDKRFGDVKPGECYEELEISEEALKGVFSTEISKVVELVNKELKRDVKFIFLVGGFADNSYMRRRVKAMLGAARGCVQDIVSPPNPGAAICVGAVAIGFETGVVLSRISKKSYGTDVLGVREDDRRRVFDVFVKKNDSVMVDHVVSKVYTPTREDQREMSIGLYSCEDDTVPTYTTDPSCQELESYSFDINEDLHLGRERSVLVSMYFGRATIEVSAERLNFGSNRRPEKLYSVQFDSSTSTIPGY